MRRSVALTRIVTKVLAENVSDLSDMDSSRKAEHARAAERISDAGHVEP
jgi:hypothetical protein